MSKLEPTENQIVLSDENGNEILCEILFTFASEKFNKNYVVFYKVEDMESDDELLQLSAAAYVENGDGTGELLDIETEEEWAEVEAAIDDFDQNHSCECGEDCDHEDCDHDCEEHHCCCGHHHEEE